MSDIMLSDTLQVIRGSCTKIKLCKSGHLRHVFTGRNEVVAKVMFLQVCVCPQGGEEGVCLSACWDTRPPRPGRENPPWTRQTPPQTRENPPQTRETPPRPGRTPPGRRLQHTVHARPVRILLECILVMQFILYVYLLLHNGTNFNGLVHLQVLHRRFSTQF